MVDSQLLAEKASALERHLGRVAQCLPAGPEGFAPMTEASDGVILHLWQAVQIAIDLAVSVCVRAKLGSPSDYGDAFRRLAGAGRLDAALADRLVEAVGFRNIVAHAYEAIDMSKVYRAAKEGSLDLRAFLAAMRDLARRDT